MLQHQAKHNRRGVIFIATLFIIIILLSFTLVYTRQAQVYANASKIQHARNQADANVRAATQSIFAALTESVSEKSAKIPTVDQLPSQAITTPHGLYWIVKTSFDDPQNPTLLYGLSAENAKLNINTISSNNLHDCPEMEPEHADAILDWKDRNSDPLEIGAEIDYYQSLDTPYAPKNSNFEHIDELLLVKDITPSILYGEDTNKNATLDPNEDDAEQSLPIDNANGTLDLGYADIFTVYSKQKAVTNRTIIVDGKQIPAREISIKQGLINVLYAPPIVLQTIGLSDDEIDTIITYRDQIDTEEMTLEKFAKETELSSLTSKYKDILTTETYQFSADIVAISKNGKAFKRILLVIDAMPQDSQNTISPKIILYKDITHLGWPLDHAIRTQLQSGSTAQDIQDVHGTESY